MVSGCLIGDWWRRGQGFFKDDAKLVIIVVFSRGPVWMGFFVGLFRSGCYWCDAVAWFRFTACCIFFYVFLWCFAVLVGLVIGRVDLVFGWFMGKKHPYGLRWFVIGGLEEKVASGTKNRMLVVQWAENGLKGLCKKGERSSYTVVRVWRKSLRS